MRSRWSSEGQPAYWVREIDRRCPLGTGIDLAMWHANGTTSEAGHRKSGLFLLGVPRSPCRLASLIPARWSGARFLIGLGRRSPAALLSSRHRRSPAEQEWKPASDHDIPTDEVGATMAVKQVPHPSIEERRGRGHG